MSRAQGPGLYTYMFMRKDMLKCLEALKAEEILNVLKA